MDDAQTTRILTINSGSSSVKFALFQMGRAETLVLSGRMERIGLAAGVFKAKGADGAKLVEKPMHLPNHATAFECSLPGSKTSRTRTISRRSVTGSCTAARITPSRQ